MNVDALIQGPESPRVAWRSQARERILDEAWELAGHQGWDKVRVADLAERAEVSRPSIYKLFGDRAGIGQALVKRETERFLLGLAAVLDAHREDLATSLRAGVAHALDEGVRNPFIGAVLTATRGGTDALLPFLTSRPDPVFSSARTLVAAWLGEMAPDAAPRRRDAAADVVVRLTLSHMTLPATEPGDVPDLVTRTACAVLGHEEPVRSAPVPATPVTRRG
ncbi:TetR family transcriptional regulator [Streptomyces sp. MBT49]|uniref:TetR/AcrR family transcriptional regulator n=1 Tax=Streptomyces sp. MBT49 TaxID=1488380 RepID=UPI00190AD14C|nr:TetR family transcriptional regulator [Streptomyces sp. MBT49]MBK3624550.1 TetR family transcriptional regulator [Streptomyces sp. MBT49]